MIILCAWKQSTLIIGNRRYLYPFPSNYLTHIYLFHKLLARLFLQESWGFLPRVLYCISLIDKAQWAANKTSWCDLSVHSSATTESHCSRAIALYFSRITWAVMTAHRLGKLGFILSRCKPLLPLFTMSSSSSFGLITVNTLSWIKWDNACKELSRVLHAY